MNKRCSVCTHPSRAAIDRALLAGLSRRPLTAQYGLSPAALSRHTRHLKQKLALQEHRAHQAQQQALLDHLDLLSSRLDRLYHTAADFRSLHVALGCLRESIRLLSLQERFRLSLDPHPVTENSALRGAGLLIPSPSRGEGPSIPSPLRGAGPSIPSPLRGAGPLIPSPLRGEGQGGGE